METSFDQNYNYIEARETLLDAVEALAKFEERQVMISMFSNPQPCPIWNGVDDTQFGALMAAMPSPILCGYPRAGGYFGLDVSGANLLRVQPPTERQKANLSYWICNHNLEHRLFDLSALRDGDLLVLNQAWAEGHRDHKPSTLDCLLTYLQELILCTDVGQEPNKDLLMAAGGCCIDTDLWELQRYTVEQGWTGSNRPGSEGTSPFQINLSARVYVEEQLRRPGQGRPGFAESVFDVFICHATEDKADVVRPLATALHDAGLKVWYDEFELQIGDSLRRKIDKGLAASRFGVVVLSPAFFGGGWPEYELNGLVAQAVSGEQGLLPVWHNVTKHQVKGYSPSLVDRFALSTATHTVERIAAAIIDVIRNPPES